MTVIERPILLSTPMVLATLEGRKTETRRIIKPALGFDYNWKPTAEDNGYYTMRAGTQYIVPFFKCPYGNVGDILWVRETWQHTTHAIGLHPTDENAGYIYKASENGQDWQNNIEEWVWKPSIFMPKEACRLFLKIISIRIERLHDITDKDARAEGVMCYQDDVLGMRYKDYEASSNGYGHTQHDYPTLSTPKASFISLWQKINKNWNDNPWVWVLTFEKIEM